MVDVPRAQQLTRPSWLNLRTALGTVLFAVAFVTGQRALESERATSPVWVAARDIPADTEVAPGDLVPEEVKLPSELERRYASASSDLVGAVVGEAVAEGEMVPLSAVSTAAAGPGRAMTIPVSPEHAVGSQLEVGDRVDVLATFDAGDVRARTIPVVREAEILSLVSAAGLVAEEQVIGVTVAVSAQESSVLALAIRAAEIDLARVEPSTAQQESPTARAEDLR